MNSVMENSKVDAGLVCALLQKEAETPDSNGKSNSRFTMQTEPEVQAFLQLHAELRPAATEMVRALSERFAHASVCVRLQEDPDSGSEHLRFDLIMENAGAEARQTLRDFVRDELPEAAKHLRHLLSFTICRA
jgi:hypothetical protein